ncbi:hypothetical protein LSH36_219g02000 [Paralvinella palmiformis]|uniref:Uncharacterized protein n=1 Tax=Paralvinella palmiformis TaxID=53620 RepID=A0AAD9N5X5_9ANNE|nr:hypothetical protein LSH36_219g02000 [Paralvinella palmiformis]
MARKLILSLKIKLIKVASTKLKRDWVILAYKGQREEPAMWKEDDHAAEHPLSVSNNPLWHPISRMTRAYFSTQSSK